MALDTELGLGSGVRVRHSRMIRVQDRIRTVRHSRMIRVQDRIRTQFLHIVRVRVGVMVRVRVARHRHPRCAYARRAHCQS